jgi:hypothetical protein
MVASEIAGGYWLANLPRSLTNKSGLLQGRSEVKESHPPLTVRTVRIEPPIDFPAEPLWTIANKG